jgi:hypothetical protein
MEVYDIQYYILSVILLGPEYSVYFCASAIQYVLNKDRSKKRHNCLFMCAPEDIMVPLHGFKPNESLIYMRHVKSIYGGYVAQDLKRGIDKLLISH